MDAPLVNVGIMTGKALSFVFNGEYIHTESSSFLTGEQRALFVNGNIVYNGKLYKELFFENTRWYDICRWGILEQELAKYPSTNAGTVHYDPQDYYLPIPESEMRSNPLMKQSKGY